MIPQFPEFKNLELSDQFDIELIAFKYEPYSDFNFKNMWSWDIYNNIKISLLNGNLIINFIDPYTKEHIISFLGNNDINLSLNTLNVWIKSNNYRCKIAYIPEMALEGINFKNYSIEIDLNACDYIYNISQLAEYHGNNYMQKRGRRNSFVKHYEDVKVEIIDLSNSEDANKIFCLNELWKKHKFNSSNKELDFDMELLAVERFVKADFTDVKCFGLYHKDYLIGYAVFSFHNEYAINHFIKADIDYKGAYEYLVQECCIRLKELGYIYMNYLEDMGIPGLRNAKIAYRPINFLKKYLIRPL